MLSLPIHRFRGVGGTELAYRELGEGRPLVLIHGYFSTATVNWVRYGTAEMIAARGYRVVMPDLRAHGDSAKPHGAADYPPDVLADDVMALIEQLGLVDYDLGGYSLGARTTVRMLVRGATPGNAILAGTGIEGLVDAAGRGEYFRHILTNLGTFERGSPQWMAEAFLKTVGGDPLALLRILDTFVDTPQEVLTHIAVPTLVLVGDDDRDQASADQVAAAFPKSAFVVVPGDHMSAVTKPQFAGAIIDFLVRKNA